MNVTLAFDTNASYVGYVGHSTKLTCIGNYLSVGDVVWIVKSLENPLNQRVIYSDNSYIGSSSRKYSVDSSILADNSILSSLTILNLNELDSLYSYECVCNIYKRCSNTNHAKADATLVVLSQTTTSKFKKYYSSILFNIFPQHKNLTPLYAN